MKKLAFVLAAVVFVLGSCTKDDKPGGAPPAGPTPIAIPVPPYFQPMPVPVDNPFTVEGIELGRFLFYEERLSGNNTQSCSSCHAPGFGFTDHGQQFSTGIDGLQGDRNSMALINLAWGNFFFWDGRSPTLEAQALEPVINPIEMHDTSPSAVAKLQADPGYVQLFNAAFGTSQIDSVLVAKALSQFMRSMVSGNSKYDKVLRGEAAFTVDEQQGFLLFQAEGGNPPDVPGGQGGADCFHCHTTAGGMFTDGQFHNNGLDSVFTDPGHGGITGNPQDMGRFKTPTLRNIALSAPYMHDGRFQTLEEVIDHYNSGGHPSATIDPFMKYTTGGLQLTPLKKQQLLAFLNTLTDMDFENDPDFQDPGVPTGN